MSEHQPTTWTSFFFDFHILAAVFPVGVWYCIKQVNDERVFIILYAVFAVYFAGVMVRLMLTLTPCVCMLAAVGFSQIYERYLLDEASDSVGSGSEKKSLDDAEDEGESKTKYDKANKTKKPRSLDAPSAQTPVHSEDQGGLGVNVKSIISITLVMILLMFAVHCTWVTSNAYSSPSIVLATYQGDGSRTILDDFREAYYWLRRNTDDNARVMSWWDYGYQIAGMGKKN